MLFLLRTCQGNTAPPQGHLRWAGKACLALQWPQELEKHMKLMKTMKWTFHGRDCCLELTQNKFKSTRLEISPPPTKANQFFYCVIVTFTALPLVLNKMDICRLFHYFPSRKTSWLPAKWTLLTSHLISLNSISDALHMGMMSSLCAACTQVRTWALAEGPLSPGEEGLTLHLDETGGGYL